MALEFGTVTGRILITAGDSDDIGDTPDEVPAVGTVSFIPAVNYVVDTVVDVIAVAAKVTCVFDAEGKITSPGDATQKYVKLLATDSANINPQDWTYHVTFDLAPGQGTLPSFDINVPANSTVDLSSMIGVPGSVGNTVDQLEAAVASAEASAAASAASAAAALALISSPQSLVGTPLEWRTLDVAGLAYAGRPNTVRPVHWIAVIGTDGEYVPLPVGAGTTSSGTGMVPELDSAELGEDVETV